MKKLILLFAIFATTTTCVISCMDPKAEEATTTAADTLAVDSAKVDTSAVADTAK